MLPVFEKVEVSVNDSFYTNHMKVDYFPSPLHFHPEIEILLVLRGTGTCFVGDSVKRFGPGDLTMIGSNIPHVWYSDRSDKEETPDSEAIYIMFDAEIFGNYFWNLPEAKMVKKVIDYSARGIRFFGESQRTLSILIDEISKSDGLNRISILLKILDTIARSNEYEYLASPFYKNTIDKNDSNRLNKVYQYVIANPDREISLNEIATIANFSTPSFCRYFKKRTNKTFIQFLNEIRIGHACRLLIDNENYSISDVSFSCGFNNISYFIKQFKKITGFTPLSYRRKFE